MPIVSTSNNQSALIDIDGHLIILHLDGDEICLTPGLSCTILPIKISPEEMRFKPRAKESIP